MSDAREARRSLYVTMIRMRWGMLTRHERRRIWKTDQLLFIALDKLMKEDLL